MTKQLNDVANPTLLNAVDALRKMKAARAAGGTELRGLQSAPKADEAERMGRALRKEKD